MPNILSSYRVKGLLLHNRLILPPLAVEKAGVNGEVTQELIHHYDEISHGGYLSMVIAEHCFVSQEGKASKRQLSAATENTVEGLSKIAEIIHKNGSVAVAQISHAGGAATRAVTGMEPAAPSGIAFKNGETGRVLDNSEIRRIVCAFAEAAKRVKEAGFDGVEIHSAHGYLLNQFYSPLTNSRLDNYGGGCGKENKNSS